MIYAMELSPRKLWWDLFCSKDCCQQIHQEENPQVFLSMKEFLQYDENINPFNTESKKNFAASCFNCGKILN